MLPSGDRCVTDSENANIILGNTYESGRWGDAYNPEDDIEDIRGLRNVSDGGNCAYLWGYNVGSVPCWTGQDKVIAIAVYNYILFTVNVIC